MPKAGAPITPVTPRGAGRVDGTDAAPAGDACRLEAEVDAAARDLLRLPRPHVARRRRRSTCVAPSSQGEREPARDRRSTPTIVVQPAIAAASTAASPTVPVPKTAMRAARQGPPGCSAPRRPRSGCRSRTVQRQLELDRARAASRRSPPLVTECVAKLDWPKKWAWMSRPPRERALDPSAGREAAKLCSKNEWQYDGVPALGRSGRPRRRRSVMPTRSPGATFVTALPTADHDARALVPEHGRQRHRVPLVAADQIRVADPCRSDLDQNLVVAKLAELELLQNERAALCFHDCRGDLSSALISDPPQPVPDREQLEVEAVADRPPDAARQQQREADRDAAEHDEVPDRRRSRRTSAAGTG